MININDLTDKLSLPKFDLPKFDVPKFDLPKFDLPKFDLPRFDTSKIELPKVDLPKFDISRATDFARDAAYVGVGAVVVSVQTVTEQVSGQFRKVVAAAS